MWKLLWYFVGIFVAIQGQQSAGSEGPSVVLNAWPETQGRILSGIHEEFLPPPIFYESYIPIILEYKTPKWNKTDIVFNNWYTCVTDTAPYKYSCPVAFHMNQAVVNLHVDFEGLHPIQDDDEQSEVQRLAKGHYSRLLESSEFCSKIQKHFQGIWTHSEDFEDYLKALENCNWNSPAVSIPGQNASVNLLEGLVERSIGQYNYSIRLPFTRMENNFYNTFYKHIITGESTVAGGGGSGGAGFSTTNSSTSPMIPSPVFAQTANLDLVASALLSNARTTLQGAILGIYYAEKNRWVHANQDCSNHLIPQSIVTRDKFNSTLMKLEEKLQRAKDNYYYESNFKNKEDMEDFELAITTGSLSQYYSLPLTDCSHTSDESMVVRILVPIIKNKRATTLQLTRVHNIPFQYKDHVCRLKIGSSDSLKSNNHGGGFDDVYNGGGNSGSSPGFFHSSHLYIYNELTSLAYPTDCKESQLCKISEYGLNQKNADPCMSALLGKNRPGVLKSCHFHCSKVEEQSHDTPIVTRIHANAYILTGNSLNYEVKCEQGKVATSQPVQVDPDRIGSLWVNLPCKCKLIVDKKYVFHGEGRNCSQGALKVYPVMPLHFGKLKPKGSTEHGDFYAEDVGETVFVDLADFLDAEKVDGYLKNAAERKQKAEASKLSGSSKKGNKSHDHSEGSSTSLTVLWTLFIIAVIILGAVQGYILYLLKRQAGVSYVKDQRILYRVPDSPVLY